MMKGEAHGRGRGRGRYSPIDDLERLAALRHIDTILAIGRDDPSCPSYEAFSAVLWSKDIWHALRIWDGWAHDWPFWRDMILRYIGGHD